MILAQLTQFGLSVRLLAHDGTKHQHGDPDNEEDGRSDQDEAAVLGTNHPPEEKRDERNVLLSATECSGMARPLTTTRKMILGARSFDVGNPPVKLILLRSA